MNISSSQNNKINEIFKITNILFNYPEIGLIYEDIENAWVVGDQLRDLLLFKNPQFNEYTLYLQVNDENLIYSIASKLFKNEIDFELKMKDLHFNDDVLAKMNVSLLKYEIFTDVIIIFGSSDPIKFIKQNMPTAISLIGLDVANIFTSLNKEKKEKELLNKIWVSSIYKKDLKSKNITILKQKWMKDPKNYMYLELYLEKMYKNLKSLKFS